MGKPYLILFAFKQTCNCLLFADTWIVTIMETRNSLKGLPLTDLKVVNCWIFDLDNTLYPAASNLFSRVSQRMTSFIQEEYDLQKEEALALQSKMFRKYGTTLRGLMVEYDLVPERFLHYVHDIDVSDISSNPRLRSLIARLPGRRIIFTNGSIRHAERITNQLGVLDLFGDIFDIVASEFIPKPDPRPYNAMIKRFNIDPKSSIMIEDMAKNLIPAAALGMITVWLQHDRDWSKEGAEGDHINYKIDDLEYWLEELTNREGF